MDAILHCFDWFLSQISWFVNLSEPKMHCPEVSTSSIPTWRYITWSFCTILQWLYITQRILKLSLNLSDMAPLGDPSIQTWNYEDLSLKKKRQSERWRRWSKRTEVRERGLCRESKGGETAMMQIQQCCHHSDEEHVTQTVFSVFSFFLHFITGRHVLCHSILAHTHKHIQMLRLTKPLNIHLGTHTYTDKHTH